MRTVEITELLLREAQQSLLETSMALEDVVPVCEDLDNADYWCGWRIDTEAVKRRDSRNALR
jgi:pyruvate/oxaloacetate carboxyltransferase